MRILLLTQFYPPETGAAQNRLSHLARHLVNAGHMVTVLTALPNYPLGKIFEKYQGRLMVREQEHGVRIIRIWLYATKSKTFLRRMLNYCSFSLFSIFAATFKLGPQDFVVVESPPLTLGLAGFLISLMKRAKCALNISDLWPESAVALGVLTKPWLIQLATRLEEFLYAHADVITGQTQGIVNNIRRRCKSNTVTLITNGVDPAVFALSDQSAATQNGVRTELGLDKRFIVGYAGLMGLAQGLETVLHSAELLSGFTGIVFVFMGDGPERSRLESLVEIKGLRNVRFFPAQPASRMPQVLRAFDVAVVPLKRHTLFKGALPSKMFEAMGAGIPVICSIDGEARQIIEKSCGGIYVEPENFSKMAEAVLEIYHNPAQKKAMGERGYQYVRDHFDRSDAARKWESLLLAASSTCPPELMTKARI